MICHKLSHPPQIIWSFLVLLSFISPGFGQATPSQLKGVDFAKKDNGQAIKDAWLLWSNGAISQPVKFETAGRYEISVAAAGTVLNKVWPVMEVLVGGNLKKAFKVSSAESSFYTVTVNLGAKTAEVSVRFTNDAATATEDRNLIIESMTINRIRP